jgi:putative phosphotransacetylase
MGGQYAAVEQVTLVGLKLRAIENVRVLGPERNQTQVEISATDAVKLGVKAPLRDSGDLQGSAPLALIGPAGAVYLDEGCIIAARHIHMSPKDAKEAGVYDGQRFEAHIENERGMTLNNVKVRVHETYTLELHLDTDEANACGVKTGDVVTLVR